MLQPAGREANAESAEAARRLEAAAERQREHSLLAPTAGRGAEPVLPDPVPMLPTYEFQPVEGADAKRILARRSEAARAKLVMRGEQMGTEEEDGEYD